MRLHDIADAYERYKERKDEEKLRRLILPIEHCLAGIRAITVRDTAVDALCHGAPLAVPGVIQQCQMTYARVSLQVSTL